MTNPPIRICPKPMIWNEIYESLLTAKMDGRASIQSDPPIPLILGAWNFTNDYQKKARWEATIEWAQQAGAGLLIPELNDEDFYTVESINDAS